MKKIFVLAVIIMSFTAISVNAQIEKTLKKVLELKIPREGGANAAGVVWHPVLKRYYAAMAGNVDFCMGVFDVTGKRLSTVEQKTFFDVRGFWYNPNTKTLQMNGYNDFGWGEYKLNAQGFPTEVTKLHEGMNQPDEQSVGAFNPKDKVVYFFNEEGNIEKYDFKEGTFVEDIEITLGKTKKEADDDMGDNYAVLNDYNSSSVIYTGIAGAELGLLNHTNRQIELYNINDGHLTRKLSLPDDAPVEEFLDFSYCNGIYWLFDTKDRIWKGYK